MVDPSAVLNPLSSASLPVWALVLIVIWTGVWKGFALWKAARRRQVIWFIAFLVLNTVGILEILYIFLFSKIKLPESDISSKKHKK